MQAVVRPCLNAGIALVGAGVIAAAPIAPPPMNIELPTVHSAAVSLTASWGPLDPYLELLNRTFGNAGTVANQAFSSGVAPILQQLVVNQLTFVHDLNAALNQALSSANPAGLPAVLQKAISELAAGQFQNAGQTLSTGLIGVALPFVGPLLQPLNNLVNVVSLLPNIALSVGLAVIAPPLALLQSTGAAVQSMFNAIAAGDIVRLVNAVLSAPAVMLDGFLNGYAPTQTGGLLSPGLGTLSILVNIRDMIANALNPQVPVAPTTAATTEAVTTTPSDTATTVTLDVVTDTAAVDTATDTAAAVEASVETVPEVVEAVPEVVETLPAVVEEVAPEVVETLPAVVEEVAPVDETDATTTETTETEGTSKDEESDTNSGATDLSDGNKATPGESGEDSTGSSNDNADADATDSSDTTTSGASGSDAGSDSDSGSSGSDSGGSSGSSESGGTE